MDQSQKSIILSFLKSHRLAVISTVNRSNKPESAVVLFGETENLNLIICTFDSSRKFANINQNPNVSCVIGWDENITIQYEGIASEIGGRELQSSKHLYFTKHPEGIVLAGIPTMHFIAVTPRWIRYTDANKNPYEIFELTLP